MIVAGTLICFTSYEAYEAPPIVAVVKLIEDVDVSHALVCYRMDNPKSSDVAFVKRLISNGKAEKIEITELRINGSKMEEYTMNDLDLFD